MYSPTLEQHVQGVREVLINVHQENLYIYLKTSKCEFGHREKAFLSMRIG